MQGSILVSDWIEGRYGERLEAAAPGVPRVVIGPEGPAGDPATGEVAFLSGDLFMERVGPFVRQVVRAKGLRWLHTSSAGVDNPFFQGLLDRGVRLSNSSGAQAVPIAHTVWLYILALTRDLPRFLDAQARRAWEPREIEDVQGQVLGVIGLGPIGAEVARLARAFGMKVLAVRRTPRGDELFETHPFQELPELWSRADHWVLAAPLTDETRGLVDAAALAAMKPGARLINVGRGELVDEGALVKALESGHLAGAALDVFATEPLPPDHPLWTCPNVILTPHCSGANPGNVHRSAEVFLRNLAAYCAGNALENEIFPNG
ncbi:MAG: D-2-hydroxyacid dehydrogenase [Proteobacteria bacterium]|nr:D-2-hydroxyacid dehydrogenase [Pseudomonadota bacterium]